MKHNESSIFVKSCSVEINDKWHGFFNEQEVKRTLGLIKEYLDKEEELIKKEEEITGESCEQYFCPSEENVLRFAKNDLEKVRVIIIGMDPYPDPGDATGRSFEVKAPKLADVKAPSLQNILKALYFYTKKTKGDPIEKDEAKIEKIRKANDFPVIEQTPEEWFDKTEAQGVLWLNAGLTVKRKESGSHQKIWSTFIEYLIDYIKENNPNVVWVLWAGEYANKRLQDLIGERNCIVNHHPVKDSFVKNNFSPKNDFIQIEEKLREKGGKGIDWM